jgi:hypothetical protein
MWYTCQFNKFKTQLFQVMEHFLETPFKFLEQFRLENSAYLFTYNPMFYFFGYPSELIRDSENRAHNWVDLWLSEISQDIDHILILEGKK